MKDKTLETKESTKDKASVIGFWNCKSCQGKGKIYQDNEG